MCNSLWVQAQITVSGSSAQSTISSSTQSVIAPSLTIANNNNIIDFTVSFTDSYSASDQLSYNGNLPTGVTTTGWNSTKRSIVFKGSKTAAEWQEFLRRVTVTTASVCSPETRKVTFAAGETFYNPLNGHFYRVTSTTSSWTAAQATASSTSYYGKQGYLVTLTSSAENTFVSRLVGQNSWIGNSDDAAQINAALGFDLYSSNTQSEGKFYWVTGPEKGTQLTTNNGNGNGISGVYQNWQSGEPNNSGNEAFGHIYASSGFWNDFANSQTIAGIIEFGDMPGDLSQSTPQFTKDIYIQGSSSGTITGGDVSVCSGTNSTVLTLTNLTGTVVRWESSMDNFILPGTSIANTTSSLTVTNISETTYYRAIVNSTSPTTCSGLVTSSAPVYVSNANPGNVFAINTTICSGSDVSLYMSGQEGDVQKWQRSNDNSNWTDITNTTTTLVETITTTGTVYYRVFVQVSGCSGAAVASSSKEITIVSGTPPIGGQVSSNTHSSLTNSGTLTLTGETGSVSKWQKSTDNGVVWLDVANTATTYTYTNITIETIFRAVVVNGSCGATNSNFGKVSIVLPPTITSFTPTETGIGAQVVITGTNFDNVTNVKFGAINATSFIINSDSQITAIVSSSGASGEVSVTNVAGTAQLAGFVFDGQAPSGYTVVIDQSPINPNNEEAVSFTFSGAEVGSTYGYTYSSSAGGTNVTGTGTISSSGETISGIDLSGLNDGTITLSVTLTDTNDNTGSSVTDTEIKDTETPSGYSVVIDQSPINSNNEGAASFTVSGAEVGSTYSYTYSSSAGGSNVTGTGTVSSSGETISGIDLSGLNDGTITLSVTLTDTNGNAGSSVTDTEIKDADAPSGYSVVIDQSPITSNNQSAASFSFLGAEVGSTYSYTYSSSTGGSNVTGTGTVSSSGETISGIDLSGLNDGTITLSVTLTDTNGNAGSLVTDTEIKDAEAPSGYSVVIDQSPINPNNEGAASFTFSGAEVGSTYSYSYSSSAGGSNVTGTGTVSSSGETISGIDLSGLNDGIITLSVTLTDTNDNVGSSVANTKIKGIDTDGDGIVDNEDTDDDGDGTPDTEDAFPLDPNEDTDTDGDGTGDNEDTDADNDGTPDTEDAFPLDENEDTDTDGDGTGDNADTDDDGDGTPDTEDAFPLDENEDTDTDGDGTGDNADLDTDSDGDGIQNGEDAFPFDPNEDTDTDGDGIGDNEDTDDDGDGIPDDEDAFPLDPTEDTDTDGDGTGDNADTDDDNDGILDDNDAFPKSDEPLLVPSEVFTPNGDGNNDNWVIPGIDNYPNSVVKVYNRWGHEIFSANGYQNNWGGAYNSNSEKLPAGSYLYVIDLGNGTVPIRGWIFINY